MSVMSKRKVFLVNCSKMGYIDISYQTETFIYSLILGLFFCVLYDFIRALHSLVLKLSFEVFIIDILYWIITTITSFFFIVIRCNGQIRLYVIIGLVLGFVTLRVTLSKLLFLLFQKIISFIVWILHLVSLLFDRIFIHINKILRNLMLLFKKLLQPKVKLLYNCIKLKCKRKGSTENGSAN